MVWCVVMQWCGVRGVLRCGVCDVGRTQCVCVFSMCKRACIHFFTHTAIRTLVQTPTLPCKHPLSHANTHTRLQ